eukprot:3668324-Rhodomonas_salina.2
MSVFARSLRATESSRTPNVRIHVPVATIDPAGSTSEIAMAERWLDPEAPRKPVKLNVEPGASSKLVRIATYSALAAPGMLVLSLTKSEENPGWTHTEVPPEPTSRALAQGTGVGTGESHAKDSSTTHALEHPSPLMRFPSSHSSAPSTRPSPHSSQHATCPMTKSLSSLLPGPILFMAATERVMLMLTCITNCRLPSERAPLESVRPLPHVGL